MAKQNPIPQNPIGESFVWRDWFQRLSDKVFGSAAAIDVPIQPEYGGTGITTYNKGDIIYSNATNNLTRLAAPAITSVLQMTALGVPSWTTVSTGTVTSVSGTGTVNGLTLTGTVTTSGNLTLGGTLDLSSPPAIGSTTAAAGTFTTLRATGQTSLGGAAGSEGFRATVVSGANMYVQAAGGVGGVTRPSLGAVQGGGSSAGFNIYNSGNSPIYFATSGPASNVQLLVNHTSSAVNYVQVTGAATGNWPVISSQGSDSNSSLGITAKGSGSLLFFTNNGSQRQFRVLHTASAVNYITATGSAAGTAPSFTSDGTDTNIDLTLTPKGTGNVRFGTYTASMALTVQGYIEIKDSGGTVRKLAVIA